MHTPSTTHSTNLPRRSASIITRPLFSGLLWTCLLLGLLLLLSGSYSQAQQTFSTHAGVIISFENGEFTTACVDLGADGEATGEEVLLATGLDIVTDDNLNDEAAICKIEDDGCAVGAPCFCQCRQPDADNCRYWAYFHLVGGEWEYGGLDVSTYIVQAGDVEGWSWGPGVIGKEGTEPPVRTFDQICVETSDDQTPNNDSDQDISRPSNQSDATTTATPGRTTAPTSTARPETSTAPENETTQATPTTALDVQSLICPRNQTTIIQGTAPPNMPLLLFFDGRTVGGGTSNAAGLYSLPLVVGSERPDDYLVQVKHRTSREVVRELICRVP